MFKGRTHISKTLRSRLQLLSQEELYDLYWGQQLPAWQIGESCGRSRQTIISLLRYYGIPVRPRNYTGLRVKELPLSSEEIVNLYVSDGLSAPAIAAQCNCDPTTIASRLKQAGVVLRKGTVYDYARVAASERMKNYHRRHSTKGDANPFFGKTHNHETRVKIRRARAGQVFSREVLIKRGESLKKAWASLTVEERNDRFRATRQTARPNKPESYVLSLLEFAFPGEWAYVGDGKLMINGFNPDFANINGQKKLIEVFGTYWHMGENARDRAKVFEPFGYKTLVIWEHELCDGSALLCKLAKFGATSRSPQKGEA